MDLFHIIDDGVVILRVKGQVWKQTKLYRCGQHLYAPHGGGFIRLVRGGGTTYPNVSWNGVEGADVFIKDNLPQYVAPKKTKAAPALTVVGE